MLTLHSYATSQSCPSCYYVDRKNRNSRHDSFSVAMSSLWFAALLPSKDDFIAACNIAERLSVLPNSTKLHQSKIKDLLMEKHEQVKGSRCLQNVYLNIECCELN